MIDLIDYDVLAGEYVLGTLNHDERTEVAKARLNHATLDASIKDWEQRLSPLNEIAPEATPSPEVFAKIKNRLFGSPVRPPISTSERKWRALAIAACLALCIVSSLVLTIAMHSRTTSLSVAVLQKDPTAAAFIVSLDEKHAQLTIQSITEKPPADKSYELWFIAAGDKTPHSLGVLPDANNSKTIALRALDPTLIRTATLAVTVEPPGGSPTGLPTGHVVFTGTFTKTTL